MRPRPPPDKPWFENRISSYYWAFQGAAMSNPPRPSDGELAILRVLWDRGPSTVREIHEVLHPEGAIGYNTTLKLLQIMLDKGLARRDDSSRQHVYEAALPQEATQRHLVQDMLSRAFAGDTSALIMRALEAKTATDEELQSIQKLLVAARKARKG